MRWFSGARPMVAAASLAATILALAGGDRAAGDADPLAAEIARWSSFLRAHGALDDNLTQIRAAAEPPLRRAEQALRDHRRLLALQQLASARLNLAAMAFLDGVPAAGRADSAEFATRWVRDGQAMRAALSRPRPDEFAGTGPALLRALAEGARPAARLFYDAARDYASATAPQYGLYYLGMAHAEEELVAMCRSLSTPAAGRAPPVRAIDGELDALEDQVLAAYRPPLSIDRHPEFIGVSVVLKEAREMNAAGLHYGALLRYLQAAARFGPLQPPAAGLDRAALAARLDSLDARLAAGAVDHSLGRLFVESARAELAGAPADSLPPGAAAIATDVLPRYFAALGPPPPVKSRPRPSVTVTLVRWPFT